MRAIAVCITALDSRRQLLGVIDALRGCGVPFSSLVVFDRGSHDGSPAAVRERHGASVRVMSAAPGQCASMSHARNALVHDAFTRHGRENQFSYNGLRVLFDYLENELEGEYVLDVVELSCNFVEYKDFEEFQGEYPTIETMERLRNKTMVLEFDGGFLIRAF